MHGDAATSLALGATGVNPLRWWVDRALSVSYGVVYDYIFDRFPPYRALKAEVLGLFDQVVEPTVNRRHLRVLDIGCGPGNFSLALAEAGFSTVGIDAYRVLIDLAREKRQAKHLPNLSFQEVDLAAGHAFPDHAFDHLVNVHSLYVHPAPEALLKEACRVLKPGGHAVFVNFNRRVELWPTVRATARRHGLVAALQCLLWVFPNDVFEMTRRRVGPHYWSADDFAAKLSGAGFTVLDVRPTFFDGASFLAWTRKDP